MAGTPQAAWERLVVLAKAGTVRMRLTQLGVSINIVVAA